MDLWVFKTGNLRIFRSSGLLSQIRDGSADHVVKVFNSYPQLAPVYRKTVHLRSVEPKMQWNYYPGTQKLDMSGGCPSKCDAESCDAVGEGRPAGK